MHTSSKLIGGALWLLVAGLAVGQNPLAKKAGQDSPFAGNFVGKDIRLELAAEATAGRYAGWLHFEANRYKAVATDRRGTLEGQFEVGAEKYDFAAKFDGKSLRLTSGGETYTLEKQGGGAAPPAGPLEGGGKKGKGSEFYGRFTDGTITLELAPNDQYPFWGSITFEGMASPCHAQEEKGVLKGSFLVGKENVAFEARMKRGKLVLKSAGDTYELSRVAGESPIAPPPAVPTVPSSEVRGGVGLALLPNDQGELVVRQVHPNSPAGKSKVPVGAIVRAVDGRSVRGVAPEEVVGRIGGPIGSLVTVTVETEKEVLDFVLQRIDVSSLGRPAIPGGAAEERAPGPPPAAATTPLMPAGADHGFPEWVAPGTRITWYLGSSSSPSVNSSLKEDDQGNWYDPTTGKRFSDVAQQGTASAGYLQLNVAGVSPEGMGVEVRNYVLADAQTGSTYIASIGSLIGNRETLGEYWIHPAKLATMQPGDQGGMTIIRGPYPMEGRVYDSVTMKVTTGYGTTRHTYDTKTGLCISYSSALTGAGVSTIDPNSGRVSGARGQTTIVVLRLLAFRELDLPWRRAPLPDWIQAGREFGFSGTYHNQIPGGIDMPPWRVDAGISVQNQQDGFATGKFQWRLSTGFSQPTTESSDLVIGPGLIGGIHCAPAALARFPAARILDEAAITRVRTTLVGSDGKIATIREEGPLESLVYNYDLRSGKLVGSGKRLQQGVATITVQLAATQ